MSVTSLAIPKQYIGNGSTTTFAFPFIFFNVADFLVLLTDTSGNTVLQVLGTNYTVPATDANNPAGTTITMLTAPPTGYTLTIIRKPAPYQTGVFTDPSSLNKVELMASLDYTVTIVQWLWEMMNCYAITFPPQDPNTLSGTLPPAVVRAGKIASFDLLGNIVAQLDLGNWRGNWVTGTAYTFRDIFQDSSTYNIYLVTQSYTSGASIAADVSAGDAVLVANFASVTTEAAAAAASATAAAASATSATSSASSATSSASSASTSAATATTQAGNASTSATSAASSATAAASSATSATSSATSASASATAAAASAASVTLPIDVQDFRLTLTSNTPVTTADVTAATTLYMTPCRGNTISLYVSGAWASFVSTQMSIAVPSTTNTMYDVFCYANSGTPTMELLVWTTITTRATAIAYQNGVLVKSGDATRRYIGSFCTTGTSGQTEDSVLNRLLYNYNNRIEKMLFVSDSTASWSYTSTTWRPLNNSTTNRLTVVQGVAEDALTLTLSLPASAPSGYLFGINTNATTGTPAYITVNTNATGNNFPIILPVTPLVGLTYYQAMESGNTGANANGSPYMQYTGVGKF